MNYYVALGLDPTADALTVRSTYRRLARRLHPDFGGDTRAMATLNAAWHVLGDPARRAAYDARLATATPRVKGGRRDGSTILDFGRYEGWTIREVADVDDDYLTWLARMPLGRPLWREIDLLLAARRAHFEAARPPSPDRGRFRAFARR